MEGERGVFCALPAMKLTALDLLRMRLKSRHLSSHDAAAIFSLLRLYRQADLSIADFCRSTGMHCIPSCGRCCQTRNVDATVTEVMPLASGYGWTAARTKC